MINPWNIMVDDIAIHHKVVDTISIIKNQNELKLKIGEDEYEKINAVYPYSMSQITILNHSLLQTFLIY